MAEPLAITFLRDPAWEPTTRVQLRVGGDVQPDRIVPWLGQESVVLGYQVLGDFELGESGGYELGEGLLGEGMFGIGAAVYEHSTLNSFDTADIDVELRSVDALGNASAWSPVLTHEHRPPPSPPRNFAPNAAGDKLVWDWP